MIHSCIERLMGLHGRVVVTKLCIVFAMSVIKLNQSGKDLLSHPKSLINTWCPSNLPKRLNYWKLHARLQGSPSTRTRSAAFISHPTTKIKSLQAYGMDGGWFPLADAHWILVETFLVVGSGVPNSYTSVDWTPQLERAIRSRTTPSVRPHRHVTRRYASQQPATTTWWHATLKCRAWKGKPSRGLTAWRLNSRSRISAPIKRLPRFWQLVSLTLLAYGSQHLRISGLHVWKPCQWARLLCGP